MGDNGHRKNLLDKTGDFLQFFAISVMMLQLGVRQARVDLIQQVEVHVQVRQLHRIVQAKTGRREVGMFL